MTTSAHSAHQRRKFLEQFKLTGNVKAACLAIGLPRRTLYDWREHDREFEAAYLDAQIEATEMLEEEARSRAVTHRVTRSKVEPIRDRRGKPKLDTTGEPIMIEVERVTTWEGSDNLLMFLLKARAPEKYRERFDLEMSGKGGGAIPISLIDSIVAKADGKEAVS